MLDRTYIIDQQFIKRIQDADFPIIQNIATYLTNMRTIMDQATAIALFDSQIKSRLLDLMARQLKEQNVAYYTIGSSGHEGNVVFGKVFRVSDMAFLHYRSGAFYLQRAKQLSYLDGVRDILLSLVAAAADPISGGRHKVFGSVPLTIPPQTSTIASHLPKALGTAFSITRAKELDIESKLPADSVILCSFGDASINHAVAQTTFNACSWLATQAYPLPIIFLCEDNGLGISVRTPAMWVERTMSQRPGIHYIACDGLNIVDTYQQALTAEYLARTKKQPVFLHMKCVRLLGHAGSDIEAQYSTYAEIVQREVNDPLLYTAHLLYKMGWMSIQQILDLYQDNRILIANTAQTIMHEPKMQNAQEIMSALLPPTRHNLKAYKLPALNRRKQIFGTAYTQLRLPRNLCQHINLALTDLMLQYPNILVFGEDVGKKGGVYRVTADLQARFGQRRVFDTLLDETTILGTALGVAHNGFLPIPEIQFLAYLHNAEDQLRGEAATLAFFSNGQFQNPIVLRIAALAYQKGFGGHFHNDNSIAILRDLPGVIVACPSNGPDAAMMLRTCVQLAHEAGRVIVFLEPIALYMTKDLHTVGDNGWLFKYPSLEKNIPLGTINSYGYGDTVIISYANGYYLSRQAAQILKDQHRIDVRVIDLRWLSPLPMPAILSEVATAKRVLIVDEGRRSASISEGLITLLLEQAKNPLHVKRITGEDCFIPLGNAWQYLLPNRDTIVDAVVALHATSKEIVNGRFVMS